MGFLSLKTVNYHPIAETCPVRIYMLVKGLFGNKSWIYKGSFGQENVNNNPKNAAKNKGCRIFLLNYESLNFY